jgi:hypothetical protein
MTPGRHNRLVLLSLLGLWTSNAARSADWVLVSQSGISDHFVDTASIKVDSSRSKVPGSIRLSTWKFTHKAPEHAIKIPWIEYTILLIAFDCKEHRGRIDEMTFFLSDGSNEKQTVNDPVLWDSGLGDDGDLVCNWGLK